MREVQLTGADALAGLTEILHRVRLADDTWGTWEAADPQWWWRLDQRSDPRDCTVWEDDDGRPAAAVTAIRFHEAILADVIRLPHAPIPEAVLAAVRSVNDRHAEREVLWSCPSGDHELSHALRTAGAQHTDERMIAAWIESPALRAIPELPAGYMLRTRVDSAGERDHHMTGRSGAEVEQRLRETSLYRPDLDLWIETGDGACAGYALFWPDPVTKVGLVEPVRVEDEHQGRGLASFLVLTGAHGLAAAGCDRIKVSYFEDNPVARRTYLGRGFRPTATIETLAVRPGPTRART